MLPGELLRNLTENRTVSIPDYREALKIAKKRFTYKILASDLGVNQFYLWSILNTADYVPPDDIAECLGIEPESKKVVRCSRCGQFHPVVKSCKVESPGSKIIKNPSLKDLQAAYINVMGRSQGG